MHLLQNHKLGLQSLGPWHNRRLFRRLIDKVIADLLDNCDAL